MLCPTVAAPPDQPPTAGPAADGPAESAGVGRNRRLTLTAERRAAAGLEIAACERRTLPQLVHTTGTIEVDADREAHVGARLPGVVLDLAPKGHIGERVAPGDELAYIHSLEFGKIQTEYLRALAMLKLRQKTYDRENELFTRKVSSGRECLEAETELAQAQIDLQSAQNQLENLGAGRADLEALAAGKVELGRMTLRAPIAGSITSKHLVKGEHADTSSNLLTIADFDNLWLFADVYERDLARVEKGQSAQVYVAAYVDKPFSGRITHVAGMLSVETRTNKVRIELENASGRLKPGMFATVDIAVGERPKTLAIPEAAVQMQELRPVVFVEVQPNVFQQRGVSLGVRFGGYVEVLEGLAEKERVATVGSFLLKSELEKAAAGE
ncbi:MAG: efflux RND transporter periplasmic adaptor subunit [Planctomycetes bacterium]|nr:efflux RND transporter periplasmic adaptor subunit [Planctomycetota bacterium]